MINEIGKDCYGCGACVSICAKRCISLKPNEEGFLYPIANNENCIHCGLCEQVCPALNSHKAANVTPGGAWGIVSGSKTLLKESSSGGAFTEIAEIIIREGGCVFGAAFSDDYRKVHHIKVETVEELAMLRGSKYLQSEIGDCFCTAKEELKKKRKVLFSGTPCQIAGLKSFLGEDDENLYCIDLICHGVPSAVLWQAYLDYIERTVRGKAKKINFRYKEDGWRMVAKASEEDILYYQNMRKDSFFYFFLKNYCLRESCYRCKTKGNRSSADMTIGDFWGVEKVVSQDDISMGVSLVLVNTQKGKMIVEKMTKKETITMIRVDYADAITGNEAYSTSVKRPVERSSFYKDLKILSWEKMVKKYKKDKFIPGLKKSVATSVVGKVMKKTIMKKLTGSGYSSAFQGLLVVLKKE